MVLNIISLLYFSTIPTTNEWKTTLVTRASPLACGVAIVLRQINRSTPDRNTTWKNISNSNYLYIFLISLYSGSTLG